MRAMILEVQVLASQIHLYPLVASLGPHSMVGFRRSDISGTNTDVPSIGESAAVAFRLATGVASINLVFAGAVHDVTKCLASGHHDHQGYN